MYKHSASRGHRAKGIKGKHVLQFCVLLVVCFWLIYQVKHSHDKRKEFETKDEKFLEKMKPDGEIQRLGRKDLPSITQLATDEDKHGEDEEEREPEQDENKHPEEELERENSIIGEREEENVSRGGGDGELDEKEPEQTEAEREHEENQADEVKEREENEASEENRTENEENEGGSEENNTENEENEGGTEENHTENEENEDGTKDHPEADEDEKAETEDHTELEENENVGKEDHDQSDATSEDQDHDGSNTITHEAQEELYKGDDASSEVAHNVQTGHENGLWGNIDFGHENGTRTSGKDNGEKMPIEGEANTNGTASSAKVTQEKKYESKSAESENSSLQNSTLPSLPKDQPGSSNNSTADDGEHSATLLSNGTQAALGSNRTENVNSNNGESLSSNNKTSASSHEKNGTHAMSAGQDSSLDEGKKLENSTQAVSDEASEYQSSDEAKDAIQHDPIDVSDTDPETLPEVRSEVQNTDDTMAE